MSVLRGKKILLGVSGGIAAYKTANLVRLFIKLGAEVQVVMTPSAKDFITPLTLGTLSKREVFSAFYEPDDENAKWNNHVRSEEHTSELQSRENLVCRLLLEK